VQNRSYPGQEIACGFAFGDDLCDARGNGYFGECLGGEHREHDDRSIGESFLQQRSMATPYRNGKVVCHNDLNEPLTQWRSPENCSGWTLTLINCYVRNSILNKDPFALATNLDVYTIA
jgi:hypothetical protein